MSRCPIPVSARRLVLRHSFSLLLLVSHHVPCHHRSSYRSHPLLSPSPPFLSVVVVVASDFTDIRIQIELHDEAGFARTIATNVPNSGLFTWTLPRDLRVAPSGFRVHVSGVDDTGSPHEPGFSPVFHLDSLSSSPGSTFLLYHGVAVAVVAVSPARSPG